MAGSYRNLDRVDNNAVYGTISVSTSATHLKVGASPLTNRDYIIIQPKATIYIGFNNSVTTSTGIQVFKDQTLTLEVGENIEVWAITASGTADTRIAELA
jgi:hypothetical protein